MGEQYLNDLVKAILRDPTASDRAKLIVNVVSHSHDVSGIAKMIHDYGLTQEEMNNCACIAATRSNVESYVALVKAGAASDAGDVEVLMRDTSEQEKPSVVKLMVSYGMDMNESLLELYCTPDEDSI